MCYQRQVICVFIARYIKFRVFDIFSTWIQSVHCVDFLSISTDLVFDPLIIIKLVYNLLEFLWNMLFFGNVCCSVNRRQRQHHFICIISRVHNSSSTTIYFNVAVNDSSTVFITAACGSLLFSNNAMILRYQSTIFFKSIIFFQLQFYFTESRVHNTPMNIWFRLRS